MRAACELMQSKKVLVLDVDETLLTLEPLFFLERFVKNYEEYEGKPVTFPGTKSRYYIARRPRLKEFFTEAKKRFRLAAFSAARRKFTLEKLTFLGLSGEFIKIYGEEDLLDRKKNLQKVAEDLNVPISDVVAIDDKPENFTEASKVIRVRPWMIGSSTEYEYESREDNLFGAFEKALAI